MTDGYIIMCQCDCICLRWKRARAHAADPAKGLPNDRAWACPRGLRRGDHDNQPKREEFMQKSLGICAPSGLGPLRHWRNNVSHSIGAAHLPCSRSHTLFVANLQEYAFALGEEFSATQSIWRPWRDRYNGGSGL